MAIMREMITRNVIILRIWKEYLISYKCEHKSPKAKSIHNVNINVQ